MKYVKVPLFIVWLVIILELPWFVLGVFYIIKDIGSLL